MMNAMLNSLAGTPITADTLKKVNRVSRYATRRAIKLAFRKPARLLRFVMTSAGLFFLLVIIASLKTAGIDSTLQMIQNFAEPLVSMVQGMFQ